MSPGNRLAVSVVSFGEIEAIVRRTGIGERKHRKFNDFLNAKPIIKVNIDRRDIFDKYGIIDAYSQGKILHDEPRFSSRNMGKNDLWIAATASVFGLTLVTTDKDFHHLAGRYIDLVYVDIEQYKL